MELVDGVKRANLVLLPVLLLSTVNTILITVTVQNTKLHFLNVVDMSADSPMCEGGGGGGEPRGTKGLWEERVE